MTKEKIILYDSDGTGWTKSDIEAYADYCEYYEENNKEDKEMKLTMITEEMRNNYSTEVIDDPARITAEKIKEQIKASGLDKCFKCEHYQAERRGGNYCLKHNDFAPVDECETVNVNVNTEVNKNKEEKKMTNGKKVSKANTNNTNNTKEEKTMKNTINNAALFKQIQAELEAQHGESFSAGALTTPSYAKLENMGLNIEKVQSIEYVDIKFNAKDDKPVRFLRALQVNIDADTFFRINDMKFLYRGEEMDENVNIYTAITNSNGTKGVYITVKPESQDKPAEDLTPDDLEVHTLQDGERIFAPAKKEIKALSEQLRVAEVEFDDNDKVVMPEGTELMIFVYEDIVERKIRKAKNGQIKKFIKREPFYNASFISPDKQTSTKYGRAFTSSEDANHRKECCELKGVKAYNAKF